MKAAVLSIALAACGAAPQPPLSNHAAAPPGDAGVDAPPSGVAGTLAKLWQLSDEMCQCRDRDCADRVVDEMMSWAQELEIEDAANPRVNSMEDAEARAATDRMSRCMSAAYARRPPSGLTP
ncbi:MAG TPA: hypothetical protein VHW23_03320 [Kofleriaceae bacterium]|nr:hypothetical protein [Kofleriaceae bacterium]